MDQRDEWIARGLYDPAASDAPQRFELLEWVAAHGLTVDEMVAADAKHQLGSLVGDRSLRPGRRMTIAAIADVTGLSAEQVTELSRATGVPPLAPGEAMYTEPDIPMFELFATARQFFSDDELIHFTRVVGSSMRRIAEAAGEMFLRDVEARVWSSTDATPLEMAKASLAGVQLAHSATQLFDPLFRAHVELSTEVMRRAREGIDDYSTMPLAVGFVDLNGFTAKSGRLSASELLELVMTFESAALDLVSEHGGRLIKLIGDEVMFSTVEPTEACAVAAALVREASTWASGGRAGIAHGHVITSGGDVYGEIVNLAARIVDIAVPGEVLVNRAVVERADALRFESAGRRQLKGFAEPVRLWSLADSPE
jgi:class 3 adenylate cyclase